MTSTLSELLAHAATSTPSRWLVYDGSPANSVGVLPVRSSFGPELQRGRIPRLGDEIRLGRPGPP